MRKVPREEMLELLGGEQWIILNLVGLPVP